MYTAGPIKLPKVADGGGSLLSPADFARAAGISLSTVWRRLRSGELPSVKAKGKRLVPASALLALKAPEAAKALTADHPIWALVGAGKSGGAGPGSSDKRAYLAEEAQGRRK